MNFRKNRHRLLGAIVAVTALATGGFAVVANASEPAPTNPKQAYGPDIITVEQTNMCMWGSKETPFCFENTNTPDSAAWKTAELKVAASKRTALVAQYQRHKPDVLTVTEGCLGDLEQVAEAIGYQLKYQETGGGTDDKARECSVDRGVGVNAILAKKFVGDGPKGYFQKQGYRSYVCAQAATTTAWKSFRVCTAHLSLPEQDGRQPIECAYLRDKVLGASSGDVVFAGDLNMKGPGQHCAPSGFNKLKNTERDPADNTSLSGLQHIYYSSSKIWRQSCGWSYGVENTDHRGFLLELGRAKPADDSSCWRGFSS